jgi:hypothetical protein
MDCISCEYPTFCFMHKQRGLVLKIMHAEYYEWPTIKGRLTIEIDQQKPWLWDLCLDGTPLRRGYNDPDKAAFDANRSDVGDPRINSILRGIYAPGDLRVWSQSRSEQASKNNENN